MLASNSPVLLTTVLAGALLLQPSPLSREENARTQLPPDSFARAIATGNAPLLKLCLAEGVDVNARGQDGRTPLLVATLQRDRAMIRRLLEYGAEVNLGDWKGITPVMVSVMNGDTDLLRLFMRNSAAVHALDTSGRSAAHHAIASGRIDALEFLLSRREESNAAVDLLELACESGDSRIITAVLSRTPDNLEWTPRSRRVLQTALAINHPELTRLVLRKHASPPTVEGRNTPLLAQTIVEGDAQTFRALLAAGAEPDTVLPTPCDKDFLARVKSKYVRSYLAGDEGVTLLMLAAGLARTEYVRALVDAGAARHRTTPKYKMMALYFAARSGDWKCVQMLLGKGPSPDQLRIEISLATQRASVIKDGIAILQTSVSTGRKGFETRAGEYVVTDKKRSHRSTIYHVEMPFFMRLNCLDFGMHAGVVPNYPASHGCIRLPAAVAQKIFSEIPVGTMVTIN